MIYTVTLSPSVDYLVEVENLQLGETNRAHAQHMLPGGKGINVSKVLQRLGTDSKALGFTAGFTGAFIEETLTVEGIAHNFIHTEGTSRINIKLKATEETEINGMSPQITADNLRRLKNQLTGSEENDFLVLSGSVPADLSPAVYAELMESVAHTGVQTVLDTSGLPLKEGLQSGPYLIKPNKAELSALYNEEIQTVEDALACAEQAVSDGAERVIVSLAGEGALFVSRHLIMRADVPGGDVVNSVGAGDSMVAAFLDRKSRGFSDEQAFSFSVAAGSATAFSQGFCEKEEVERLESDVSIQIQKKEGGAL
ncbi:1-phosphofructokinase [Salisediminibacterium halotolerans]|uniref:Tagatose-6-phosphate kinase n=1 Tax=Salisediminibacterium halotolerans TaxID=517425 RepID=A0A1H9UVS0_9BACI|nr:MULTISPECIES: 1-phosphofructokinase [Salisediminibacterium]RLJ80890.1 fructose-1-phosphate kinase [Actinophytocola xinjiangensis]RPE83924.1 fructose-1-phosphate kinase [Salisediminibacterium halotolerans]TWG37834.1 fructose-1-phosphate kinase [Salisediminibacterium halotolerans]SES13512.1 1-phosphofructokinase [Salisediminibacterium haloalkalitolerans]GEL08461.1 1-phosphofructokinase [Salisediminibacterium halotolerans]